MRKHQIRVVSSEIKFDWRSVKAFLYQVIAKLNPRVRSVTLRSVRIVLYEMNAYFLCCYFWCLERNSKRLYEAFYTRFRKAKCPSFHFSIYPMDWAEFKLLLIHPYSIR